MGGRLAPLSGRMVRASKLDTGFFAQHQIDDLEEGGTAYTHIAARMKGQPESKIRGRTARIGFSAARADTPIERLSGGEKARLLMGLATFDGPQLLILDEPTNHLDIDSRQELIEAINEYQGAVILISHDRRLLEACADRLWLAADGRVAPFDGDIDDYARGIVGEAPAEVKVRAVKTAPAPKAPSLDRQIAAADEKIRRFQDLLKRIDDALAKAALERTVSQQARELGFKRQELERALVAAEDVWLELSSRAESAN